MSNKLWWASLNPQAPRYQEWHDILGGDEVPLLDPGEQATMLGETPARGYLIGLAQFSAEQLDRLVEHLAMKFAAPQGEIRAEIEAHGHFPIREEDVIVAFSLRAFL